MHFTMGEGGNLPLGPDVELTLDRFTKVSLAPICALGFPSPGISLVC